MRINFSENPCVSKKEKLIRVYIPIIVVIVFTLLNLGFFAYYRMENSSSHQKINALKKKIQDYNKKMIVKSSILKKINFKRFKKEYQFYYSLTMKKRLSWQHLFEQFEEILPENVKLSMISPKVEKNAILLSISAEAKDKESELEFINRLEKSKYFAHPFVEYESFDRVGGFLKFSITVKYIYRDKR